MNLFFGGRWLYIVATISLLLVHSLPCNGMIRGDKGNKKVDDPGWPTGSAAIFNTKNRIAWYEDPPFGGGRWHSECQGNSAKLNELLVSLKQVDAPKKRIVVYDGIGRSFWLDPNGEHRGDPAIEVDWVFIVWQPESWQRQKTLPMRLSALLREGDEKVPVPEIRVYTDGAIRWNEVQVPEGIEVVDNRREAHGFHAEDGRVLQGKVTDASDGKGLAAQVRIEHVMPKAEGGYEYQQLTTYQADESGLWTAKNVDGKWCRAVAEVDGYAPRVIGYFRYGDQPGWEEKNITLARTTKLRGRIIDQDKQPLPGVSVDLSEIGLESQPPYESSNAMSATTDKDGRFEIASIAGGKGRVWVHCDGYVRADGGVEITLPSDDIEIQMNKSSTLTVQVEFPNGRPTGSYLVKLTPEGGDKIGSWGGSGNIDEENSISFKDIPAGKYTVTGRPNPGSDNQQTKEVPVELKPGRELNISITAKR